MTITDKTHELASGEVRLSIFESREGIQAFLMSPPGLSDASTAQALSLQVSGVFDTAPICAPVDVEHEAEIRSIIDSTIDDVSPVQFVAHRGQYNGRDVFAGIFWADLHPTPWEPEQTLRIAAFPISDWEDRKAATEQALRAMALQRASREELTQEAAKQHNLREFGVEEPTGAIPLPGLRLLRDIPGESPDLLDEQTWFQELTPEQQEATREGYRHAYEHWAWPRLAEKPFPAGLRCRSCKEIAATWKRPWDPDDPEGFTRAIEVYETHKAHVCGKTT